MSCAADVSHTAQMVRSRLFRRTAVVGLTFPFSGLGIVDALVLAAVVEAGGLEVEAAAVAALVVWRVFTVAVPILMGLGAVTAWRRGWLGDVPPEAESPPSP
jgi:hypothetical protein